MMKIEEELASFTGTENYYRHWMGLLYTDGVNFLVEKANCYWLLDAVVSYQHELNNKRFQIWKLEKKEDSSAVLTMQEDEGAPILIEQKIPYTNFPLESVVLWLENGVIYLPSEH